MTRTYRALQAVSLLLAGWRCSYFLNAATWNLMMGRHERYQTTEVFMMIH
jgi:hypothetical protein